MKIAILTDASFDGDINLVKDLYMVPLLIVEEDGTTHQNDQQFDKHAFYEMLESQKLKTSMTPPGVMIEMWDKLLQEYDQIIVIPISKGLSGQFSTFRMLSQTEDVYKGKVFVCDSNGVSVANQEIVRRVHMWIEQGKNGDQILDLAQKASEQMFGYIIPKSLETLKRGGRISPAAASLAKMLKIVPILRFDGNIDKKTTARTFKKAIITALNLIKEESTTTSVDLAYSKMSNEMLDEVKQLIVSNGFRIRIIAELSPVVTCHTGPETVAIVNFKDEIGE